jgi:glycosyltransferase involved in cell wall biosynthesis
MSRRSFKKTKLKLKQKVMVITNYRPDQQDSMLRFGHLLTSNQLEHPSIELEEVFPLPIFTKICINRKIRKWAAYLDKYLLFPKRLKRELINREDPLHLIHIIDHSNAIYLPQLKRITHAKKVITCHDLIAIRTAKDEFIQAPQTSKSGKRLQNWIENSLNHADFYACDSRQTLNDLNRLIPQSKEKSSIFHLGTEESFSALSKQENLSNKLPFDPSSSNFLLHVGSSAWYKNRRAILCSFIHTQTSLPDLKLKLVLVGPEPQKEELDDQLSNWIKSNPSAIHSLQNLPEKTLGELYKYAKALIFPSFIEGYGWPPLEAAIHGCPVITTRTGAIEDLLGDYAKYVEADKQASIDQGVEELLRSPGNQKDSVTLLSYEDCRRQYFNLYEQMMVN